MTKAFCISTLLSVALLAGCVAPTPLRLDAASAPMRMFSENGQVQITVKARKGQRPRDIGRKIRQISPLDVQVISVPRADLEKTLKSLSQDKAVQYAQPCSVVKAMQEAPNDPLFTQQYAPRVTKAVEAWPVSRGGGVSIAIVDTGIDPEHPDLKRKLKPGFNALDQGSDVRDENGHGTHCAGIAAASTNNGVGIAGIAPDASILPVKALGRSGQGSDATVAEGIVWAADHGASIISLSLGTPDDTQVLKEACEYALKKGAFLVAAMGNAGNDQRSYPAAYPGVMAVGATGEEDQAADFSQYGDWISVSAPGVAIYSTFPTYAVELSDYGFPQDYAAIDGTSQATPIAAGVAALLKAKHPGLTAAQLKQKIESSADPVGAAGFDIHFGHGRINALRALS
ncbi:MAG: S8 family peptidase [Bacteroidota bacterium]